MPAESITQTCPARECNLVPSDIERFVDQLAAYYELFEPAFRRPEQVRWGEVHLNGLLGDLPRKTTERIALDLDHNVRDLQPFIGQSRWPTEPLVVIHQQLVVETLGEEDGVALIDESGVVKQGDDPVGRMGHSSPLRRCRTEASGQVKRPGYPVIRLHVLNGQSVTHPVPSFLPSAYVAPPGPPRNGEPNLLAMR